MMRASVVNASPRRLQAGRRRTAGSASSSRGRAWPGACRLVPVLGDERSAQRSRDGVASRRQPFTQVVPCAASPSARCPAPAVRRGSRRPRRSRVAFLAAARAAIALGDASLSSSVAPACRNARGACCSMPSVAPRRLQQRRQSAATCVCGSPRRRARTAPATAIGVLKSSFIAARKRGGVRLVPVELPPLAGAHRVERGVEPRAARCARRRGARR